MIRRSTPAFFLLLAILECAWAWWFLAAPLPNAKGQTRGGLLWIALPYVVDGVTPPRSLLAPFFQKIGEWAHLPQRLPYLATAGLIAAAGIGLGTSILRALKLSDRLRLAERLALGYLIGLSALGVIALIVGRFGGLSPWPTRVVLGLMAAIPAGIALRKRIPAPDSPALPAWPFLAAAPFLILMALGAMQPTIDYDALEYHIQGPKEYYQAERIAFLPHNVYTSMPFNVEMLHLLGMTVLDDWWGGALAGQVLIAGFAASAAVLIGATAARWSSPLAGAIAALAYLSTPWIYRLGVLPYVEGPLCAYHAGLLFAASLAWGDSKRPAASWLLVGLLAGGAMGCKYPALISAVIPFGALACFSGFRNRGWRPVGAYALGAAAIMAPWLLKNVADTGNPVYPLAYRWFGGVDWDPALDAKWSKGHGRQPIGLGLLWASIVDVAGRSDWQSLLYTALAPLSLLRREGRGRVLATWGFVAYIFATWWLLTHRLDRFWLPLLPGLAILAGIGFDAIRGLGPRLLLSFVVAIGYIAGFLHSITPLTGYDAWTADLNRLKEQVPRLLNPALVRLDAELPPDAKILLVGQAAVFHLRHPIVYNTVFDREILEQVARDAAPGEIRSRLRDLGVTHVYVDWPEVERYRSTYGYTDFVTPELFAGLVRDRILEPPMDWEGRQLFRVAP